VAVDEGLKRRRQLVTDKTKTAHDLACEIFRDISGPALGGVEGDDTNRIALLTGLARDFGSLELESFP
jgi:hypothetical protein